MSEHGDRAAPAAPLRCCSLPRCAPAPPCPAGARTRCPESSPGGVALWRRSQEQTRRRHGHPLSRAAGSIAARAPGTLPAAPGTRLWQDCQRTRPAGRGSTAERAACKWDAAKDSSAHAIASSTLETHRQQSRVARRPHMTHCAAKLACRRFELGKGHTTTTATSAPPHERQNVAASCEPCCAQGSSATALRLLTAPKAFAGPECPTRSGCTNKPSYL